MLILTRRPGQALRIEEEIPLHFVEIKGSEVRGGIDAPKSTAILREEIYDKFAQPLAGGSETDEMPR